MFSRTSISIVVTDDNPLSTFPEAPQRYWQAFAEAEPLRTVRCTRDGRPDENSRAILIALTDKRPLVGGRPVALPPIRSRAPRGVRRRSPPSLVDELAGQHRAVLRLVTVARPGLRLGLNREKVVSGPLNTAAHANAGELQQLSSFYRLLDEAAASRSEREIVRVFIEALAVWQDAESWAYFADVTGRFVLDVSLPESDRSRAPATLDASQLAIEASDSARIAADDPGALGFQGLHNLLLSRIRVRGASDWLIVTENPGDPTPRPDSALTCRRWSRRSARSTRFIRRSRGPCSSISCPKRIAAQRRARRRE